GTSLDDVREVGRDAIDDYRTKGHAVVRGLASQSEIDEYLPAISDATFRMRGDERPLAERDTYGKAFIQSMTRTSLMAACSSCRVRRTSR
ncbi:MAG: hypothetical protein EBY79_06025, partial [Actinobacteria bacterium]|nr:hypothetical protein [Actinomycetota bacterium]